MSCVWMLQRGHSGDGCVLASTLCKYDLRKGDLFVLIWARVRRVRRGSISSELLVCGGGVRSILLLPLVARCLETIDVCIWRMFVFMSGRFVCSELGKGATSEAGKYLFRAVSVWWRCAQYFVVAYCA